jgi:hypothetical protein
MGMTAFRNECRATLAGAAFPAVNQLAISAAGQAPERGVRVLAHLGPVAASGDMVGALAGPAPPRSAGLALLAGIRAVCIQTICIQTKGGRPAEPWLGWLRHK